LEPRKLIHAIKNVHEQIPAALSMINLTLAAQPGFIRPGELVPI
jgi:hypothetical protein